MRSDCDGIFFAIKKDAFDLVLGDNTVQGTGKKDKPLFTVNKD